ncbi:MAG: hypothetical protein ACLPZR_33220 [Solirubrobacteraceae bacterium]
MLIPVSEEPLLEGVVWDQIGPTSTKKQARAMLARRRDALAPQARIVVQSNALTWPGLLRVARLEHRGLLIVRSARRANYGHVRLGNAADVLLSHLAFPLAIAPRGMQDDADAPLERIRVGFNAPPNPKPL